MGYNVVRDRSGAAGPGDGAVETPMRERQLAMVEEPPDEPPRFTVVIPPDRPDVREELAEELSGEGVRVVLERRREERRPRSDAEGADESQLDLPLDSQSTPVLYIVSRDAPEQFQLVERHFADSPGIQVLYDRRHQDRRAQSATEGKARGERRSTERRLNDIAPDLRAVGWALVRLEATA